MNPKGVLIQKGVNIPNPESVEIGEDIDADRIAGHGVTIHTGCKLYGAETFVAEGVHIGFEGPATVNNCFIGPHVQLKGGFFQQAVFLEKSSCGWGAHVRQGSILEEQASIAHTVGLKQTILFPYVTLGSLINFCDCLMAGGTSRQNHSEVGSSYIHFNFTPNQDKATPSLLGDVSRGVMLNQSPIFLGGQGGLVGPCRIAFGTTVAAGCICRKDQMEEDCLVIEDGRKAGRRPFKPGGYGNLKRVFNHNFNYIANLLALWQWYDGVRGLFVGPDFPQELANGLKKTLKLGIDERIKQLGRLRETIQSGRSEGAFDDFEHNFCSRWEAIQNTLINLQGCQGAPEFMDQFSKIMEQQIRVNGKNYIQCIKTMEAPQLETGTQWLQSIIDHVTGQVDFVMKTKE